MGMGGIAVFIAHFEGIAHGVIAQNVFHLILRPLRKCQIACFLGVDHGAKSGCRIVSCAAVVRNHRKAGGRFRNPCAVGFRQIFNLAGGDLGVPQLVVHAEILVLGHRNVKVCVGSICLIHTRPEFQIPAEDVPVTGDVGHRCQLRKDTAPDGIPAVHPDVLPAVSGIRNDTLQIAGVGMCAHFAGDRLIHADDVVDIIIVLGAVIEPDGCPCQFIIVIAGGIETAVVAKAVHHQRGISGFVVRLDGKFIERQRIIQTLLRILRIGVFKVQIVDRQRCCCTCGLVGCRRFCGGEVCRTLDSTGRGCHIGVIHLQFRRTPIVVVVVSLTHLIAICHYVAVIVQESGFQEIVVDPAQLVLHVLLQSHLHIGVPKFVIAPAYSGGRIAARQTEFDVVSGIVPAAGQIDAAIAVRIQILPIGIDKFLTHIRADVESLGSAGTAIAFSAVLVGFSAAQTLHGHQRDHAIFHVAVSPPRIIAVICHLVAAFIGIVKAER